MDYCWFKCEMCKGEFKIEKAIRLEVYLDKECSGRMIRDIILCGNDYLKLLNALK